MNGASSNDGSYWPMNTLVHCFWCCYPFRNIPIAIPYKKIENTFYGRGNFCSFECAHRFIVETIQNDVERQRVRVLLHHLRSLMIPDQGLKQIPLAPPRETLNIFGGNLSIDDFRNVPDGMSHVITYPPMVSDIPI